MRWANNIPEQKLLHYGSNKAEYIPVPLERVEKPSIITAHEIMLNDLNKEVIVLFEHLLKQRDRIPLIYIYNAINIVQKFYREINSAQIVSCAFDDEDINMFDIDLKKGETHFNVTITIREDEDSHIITEAYLLHKRKLNYGSIQKMIHLMQSI